MKEEDKPKNAEYFCPEHGGKWLEARAIEEQWVRIDIYGCITKVMEGTTDITKVWCGVCKKVLMDHEEEHDEVFRVTIARIQEVAEEEHGRRLTLSELEMATEGIEYALGYYAADVIGIAVDNAIKGSSAPDPSKS